MSLASSYKRSLSEGSLRPRSARSDGSATQRTALGRTPMRPPSARSDGSGQRSLVGETLKSTGDRKLLYRRSQSEADAFSREPGGFDTSRSLTSKASKKRAGAVQDAEIRRILDVAGHSIRDHYHSLHKGLHDIQCDSQGNLRRGDVRRFFQNHRVPTRMADRVFDHMMGDRKGSTVSLKQFKNTFNDYVGEHVCRDDSHDGSQASHHHHHHHNVHGLLRPRHSLASHCSVVNADTQMVKEMTKEKLAKIAKQMTGNQQSRYMDKSGNIWRQEIQHLFESYGLTPEQGNELFDTIDTGRTGEIKFKDLRDRLAPFLDVKVEKRKAPRGTGNPMEDEMVKMVCDHIGEKAAAKHKNLQGAFRFVDRDFDAKVDRYEVRNFFRNYGSKTKLADRFFDRIDVEKEGKIDFHKFKEFFAPYIEPGYHAPVHGETQHRKERVAWGESHYGSKNCGKGVGQCQQTSTLQRTLSRGRTPQSARSAGQPSARSSISSVSANMGEDELHATKFGRFQGVSTYAASFNPWLYHGHM